MNQVLERYLQVKICKKCKAPQSINRITCLYTKKRGCGASLRMRRLKK